MKYASRQYPEAYHKNHSRYTYYADNHDPIILTAGENGVTEEWIALLKQMHRDEINMLRRGRSKGEGKNTLYSLEQLMIMLQDKSDLFIDPASNIENNYISRNEQVECRQLLVKALSTLSSDQKYIFITTCIQNKSLTETASEFGISRQSLTDRLTRIKKKLQKSIINTPAFLIFKRIDMNP